jgi:hypothetical protein
MGSVHSRGDTFLTFGLKALTQTNTSRLATDTYTHARTHTYTHTHKHTHTHTYIHLYIPTDPSTYLSVNQSINFIFVCRRKIRYPILSFFISMHLFINQSIYLCLSIYQSIYLSICLSIYVCIHTPINHSISMMQLSINYSICRSIYFSFRWLYLPVTTPAPWYRIILELLTTQSSGQ